MDQEYKGMRISLTYDGYGKSWYKETVLSRVEPNILGESREYFFHKYLYVDDGSCYVVSYNKENEVQKISLAEASDSGTHKSPFYIPDESTETVYYDYFGSANKTKDIGLIKDDLIKSGFKEYDYSDTFESAEYTDYCIVNSKDRKFIQNYVYAKSALVRLDLIEGDKFDNVLEFVRTYDEIFYVAKIRECPNNIFDLEIEEYSKKDESDYKIREIFRTEYFPTKEEYGRNKVFFDYIIKGIESMGYGNKGGILC